VNATPSIVIARDSDDGDDGDDNDSSDRDDRDRGMSCMMMVILPSTVMVMVVISGRSRLRVRLGKARAEQNESALPPSSGHNADSTGSWRRATFGLMRRSKYSAPIRSPCRRWRAASAECLGRAPSRF
jgi:hypothetical protein